MTRTRTTRKRKRKKTTAKSLFSDARLPKILGLLCWLVAAYLFIAYFSYLFTWKEDQSVVLNMSWLTPFSKDAVVQNKLGRLGSIISHHSFYGFVGLSSFYFVALFVLTGIQLVTRQIQLPLLKFYKYTFLLVVFTSVALSFIFSNAGFPFGGGFGKFINDWLTAFLGRIGTGLLLFFGIPVMMVLLFDLSFDKPFQKMTELWSGLFPARKPRVRTAKASARTKQSETSQDQPKILRPQISSTSSHSSGRKELEVTQKPPSRKAKKPIDNSHLLLDIARPEEMAVEKPVDKKRIPKEREIKITEEDFNPRLDLSNYKFPSLNLLESYGHDNVEINTEELEYNKDQIVETLGNYNISISKIMATVGPTITLYEIVPAPGVRISKIKSLENDIALSLAALGIRIIAPIPGKGTIGIEVPNKEKAIVSLKSILKSDVYQKATMDLPIALGNSISNGNYVADLTKMPHLLMAGATGQGKSVGINSILVSLLYKKHPSELKFVLIDPKKVELSIYNKIEKHYLAALPNEEEAIITDTKKVINTLNALCIEMDSRYELLKNAHVRNVKEYNRKFIKRKLNPEKGHRYLPYFVLVIDEFADLIMTAGKEIEVPLTRLAQLARAVGIHLVIATQRPTTNIITGTIKANFPVRIAFRVSSYIDSKTILDTKGAEQLVGRGDMLLNIGADTIRLQGAFVDTPEVERITEFIEGQQGYAGPFELPEYVGEDDSGRGLAGLEERDDLFEDAARLIVSNQQGSTSLIQRKMKLGYNRAGRIMDQLEAAGIVGPGVGSKARDVLMPDLYELEKFLNQ